MSQFNNVSIIKKANFYFDGNVTSRTIIFDDGSKKTLGVMLSGEYEFNTDAKEIMEIYTGAMDVLLADSDTWKTVKENESFTVPAKSKFKVKIKVPTDYCCSFIN